MRSVSIVLFILAFSMQSTFGQTIAEGLRYSDVNYGSTARALGIGGSFSGLGPDISVASSNPAGLAEFRKSEIVLSGFINNGVVNASLEGNREKLSSYPRNLQNVGITFAYQPIASGWSSTNFTIGLNKVATFDERFAFNATTSGTIVQRFAERANGIGLDDLDNFEGGIAFDAGAIFDFDEDFFYESDFPTYREQVFKAQTVETSGGISELVASIAGSRNNKFNIGLTVGIPFLSYNSTKTYIESDNDNTVEFFDNLEFIETLITTGVGFNAKLGLMYKLTPKIRLGGAIHSPTTFFMTDDFYNDFTYGFTEDGLPQANTEQSPQGNFKYKIRTPWKALVSGSYLLNLDKLKGFITAEAEYINYSGINFDLTAFSGFEDTLLEDDLNNQVSREFTSGLNLRIGSELVFNKLRVRGGVGLISPAYATSNTIGDLSNTFNLGLGYRGNKFYIDLAVENKTRSDRYSPYFLVDEEFNQVVDIDKTLRRLVITGGMKI